MVNLNQSLSYLLFRCNERASRLAQKALSEIGLTAAQANALTCLFERNGINQLELGEMARKDRTTISGIVSRLEATGYVRRVVDESDRRATLVYYTKKAEDMKEKMESIVIDINGKLSQDLTDSELKSLIELLNKIRGQKIVYPGNLEVV